MSERRVAAVQDYLLVPAASVDAERLLAFDAVVTVSMKQEALAAKGEAIDIGAVTTATNSLRRLLDDLAASSRARVRSQRGAA